MSADNNKPMGRNDMPPIPLPPTSQEPSIVDRFVSWLQDGEPAVEGLVTVWYRTRRFAYIVIAAVSAVAVVLAIGLAVTATNYNAQLAQARHQIDSLSSQLSESSSSSDDSSDSDSSSNSSDSNTDSSDSTSSDSNSSDANADEGDTLAKLMAKGGYDIKSIQSVDDANNAHAFELSLYDYAKTLGYGVYKDMSGQETSTYIDGLHLECNANNPNIDVRYVTVLPDYESGKFIMSYRKYAGTNESEVWSVAVIPKCGTGAMVDVPNDATPTPSNGVYYKELQKATYNIEKLTIDTMRRIAVGYGLPGAPPKYSELFEAWASYHGYSNYSYTSSYMTCGDDLLGLDESKTDAGADYPVVGYYSNDDGGANRQLLRTVDVQTVGSCTASTAN